MVNFQMNDKCAAGTGRFLEIMAASLGYILAEFGPGWVIIRDDEPEVCNECPELDVCPLKGRYYC